MKYVFPTLFALTSALFAQAPTVDPAPPLPPNPVPVPAPQPPAPINPEEPEKKIPKAVLIEEPETTTPAPTSPVDKPINLIPEGQFVPVGGIAHLKTQANLDLFTLGKDIGHVRNNKSMPYRRLVQRTIMPTEPRPRYASVLTFDDQLVADSPRTGSAIDIAKALAPLRARAIFFANVNGVSGTDVSRIMRKRVSKAAKKKLCQDLLDSKKEIFVTTMRSLLKVQTPPDANGNREYVCEVFNHTAFHQDMSRLKVGTTRYEMCIMGIEFIEKCINEAYSLERPGWKRARYFRFPFLHTPKDRATKAALNKVFTKHGLIAVGETQDSKDVDNYSATRAYKSLAAGKKGKRYNPRYGTYGQTDRPIALFHTKTWKKIKSGVIRSIKEN